MALKPARRVLIATGVGVLAAAIGGCGETTPLTEQTRGFRGATGVKVPSTDPDYLGAALFAQKCGGCHTLDVAGTEGSATDVGDRERTDGPNFNVRSVTVDDALYAIRNGGFSGAIMPENIATGEEAERIARFLARFAGREAAGEPRE